MKSSRFGRFGFLFAAALCMAAATYAADAVVSACRAMKDFVVKLAFDAVATVGSKGDTRTGPAVQRVQAKAYQRRIEKRETPVLTDSWRMCPST